MLLQLRCDTALRHLFPEDELSSPSADDDGSEVLLSRSALLLRNTQLPRHRLLCAESSRACALLISATRDLCRRYGARLNVSLLGGGGGGLDTRMEAVWRACPLARVRRDVPCADEEVGWAQLVHIQIEKSGKGSNGGGGGGWW